MAKKLLQKLLNKFVPDHNVIKQHKNLQFLGDKLHDPNLWHLNRSSVAMAFAVGLFCAWIPTPGQMAIAAVGAFYLRGNLPIAIALVWITNPVTMPPLFYFAYLVGLSVLNLPATSFSLDAVLSGDILFPFLTGCLLIGLVCATTGYFGINYFWHYHVAKKWADRKQTRKNPSSKKNPFKAVSYDKQ
ncbi:DUF2062 domain-containing protein [Methylobacter sp. S3L5C]|uniref:DUF2062 domain-containing protein n=1 Tax=Methylobacter sp. S3L5C TaxID=2839024 RepID=UPI001FAB644C|nr:DUF2062 domain-containing protein [Methylobacter sp. S3L5C]UOA08964.1 DUF2062 domain-containing protein [Methylobacter sp. S3L5C]